MKCVLEHFIFHEVVCSDPDGTVRGIICNRCGWLLQKEHEGWRIKGLFDRVKVTFR